MKTSNNRPSSSIASTPCSSKLEHECVYVRPAPLLFSSHASSHPLPSIPHHLITSLSPSQSSSSILPSNLNASGLEGFKLLKDCGGNIDAVALAAPALVLYLSGGTLAIIVDVYEVSTLVAVVRVRYLAVLALGQSDNSISLGVGFTAGSEAGCVICQLPVHTIRG